MSRLRQPAMSGMIRPGELLKDVPSLERGRATDSPLRSWEPTIAGSDDRVQIIGLPHRPVLGVISRPSWLRASWARECAACLTKTTTGASRSVKL